MIKPKKLQDWWADTRLLSRPEVDLVSAVVCAALNRIRADVACGAFILIGQKLGGSAETMLRFSLPHGSKSDRSLSHGATDFLEQAELAIDYFLHTPAYDSAETGVHINGRHRALVATTGHGRFLATLYADFSEMAVEQQTTFVLMAVADTLARISGDMMVCQKVKQTFYHTTDPFKLSSFVNKLFNERQLPEVLDWIKWRDSAVVRLNDVFV